LELNSVLTELNLLDLRDDVGVRQEVNDVHFTFGTYGLMTQVVHVYPIH